MIKRLIEFLEAASLMILTAVLIVGIINYTKTIEEPKEETPIVEVEDKKPVIKNITITSGPATYFISYEEGMTWAKWVISSYNIIGCYASMNRIMNAEGLELYVFTEEFGFGAIEPSDLIDSSLQYTFIQ